MVGPPYPRALGSTPVEHNRSLASTATAELRSELSPTTRARSSLRAHGNGAQRYSSAVVLGAMRLQSLPFAAVDWTTIPIEERAGTQGTARSRSFLDREVRVRMVEYSPIFR